jgi:hypothetical protein
LESDGTALVCWPAFPITSLRLVSKIMLRLLGNRVNNEKALSVRSGRFPATEIGRRIPDSFSTDSER